MTGANSIAMGHGQMVDIVARDAGRWELVFSEAGVAEYKAPPLADVRVEAIDAAGVVHPLAISAGGVSSVIASGNVAGAYRARVMVMHGDHFHTRESLLPGKQEKAPTEGPGGGALLRFAGVDAEAKLVAADSFEISFSSNGAAVEPPAPDTIVAQAIGPKAENFQIRALAVRAGDRPRTLIASGKIKDATYVRLALKDGMAAGTRSVPVIR